MRAATIVAINVATFATIAVLNVAAIVANTVAARPLSSAAAKVPMVVRPRRARPHAAHARLRRGPPGLRSPAAGPVR